MHTVPAHATKELRALARKHWPKNEVDAARGVERAIEGARHECLAHCEGRAERAAGR